MSDGALVPRCRRGGVGRLVGGYLSLNERMHDCIVCKSSCGVLWRWCACAKDASIGSANARVVGT